MKLTIFHPEDFIGKSDYPLPPDMKTWIADLANAAFNEWLKENGKIVQGCRQLWGESPENNKSFEGLSSVLIGGIQSTHKAILICIEPIEKCNHPKEKIKYSFYQPNKYIPPERWTCECGAKVQPGSFEEIK